MQARKTQPDAHTVWLATPAAAAQLRPEDLPPPLQKEWRALRTERRRRDWSASRVLLNGVPDIECHSSSLSHSDAYAALALAPRGENVGVDIEHIRPRAFVDMARIGFADDEVHYLESIADRRIRGEIFYTLWTLKEAFAKALSLNFLIALRNCSFIDSHGNWRGTVPTDSPWRATVFAPQPLLRLSVACISDNRSIAEAPVVTREWPGKTSASWKVVTELNSAQRPPATQGARLPTE
jgi:phosphopantetheinyl transferase (holo-ACP synthase)